MGPVAPVQAGTSGWAHGVQAGSPGWPTACRPPPPGGPRRAGRHLRDRATATVGKYRGQVPWAADAGAL